MTTIAVVGATGNTGSAIVAALADRGDSVIGIARKTKAAAHCAKSVSFHAADAADVNALRVAMSSAEVVVNAAHARYTTACLKAAADAGVSYALMLGSTRCYTRFPDDKAREVAAAEAAVNESAVRALIVHPTMIYGGNDNNVRRVMRFITRCPMVPLPNRGEALVQPVHRDDVVASVTAAIDRRLTGAPIIVAGASAISYAEMVRACGASVGRRVRIVSVPVRVLTAVAPITRALPGIPTITAAEVQRLMENKNFDTKDMADRLGVIPVSFDEGLARMKGAGEIPV